MQTINFKTKTEIIPLPLDIDKNSEEWVIGLDIGYSGVKAFCPNKYFCFPFYAKRVPADRMSLRQAQESDIRFEMNGELWNVGTLAYDEVVSTEVVDSKAEMYGRQRYNSSMFKVITLTGIAIALMGNEYGAPGSRMPVIQTGLPIEYMSDSDVLRDSIMGNYSFKVKIGGGPWQRFGFSINEDGVLNPIPQPLGALLSACTDENGMEAELSQDLYNSNVLVIDAGFGTFDTCALIKGNIVRELCNTFPELGMREVFARTCNDIRTEYGISIDIPALQNFLVNGKIKKVDKKRRRSEIKDFSDLLEKNRIEVFNKMLAQLDSSYDYMEAYDYIVAAGGTYESWKKEFADTFKDMEDGLRIIPANINVGYIPIIYSVARGNYYFAIEKLFRRRLAENK